MTEQRLAIIGLGLIGGSLGLALKRSAWPGTIIGWDRDRTASRNAVARGAIDQAIDDLEQAADADIVVIAVPVLAVEDVFRTIASAVKPTTLVTDVARTKSAICGWASELPCIFVGGHPMAGSEQHGIAAARADLFSNATYCITPTPSSTPDAIATLAGLVRRIGARPRIIDAEAHDRAVAAVSHLPFVLSTALIDVVAANPEWELQQTIAATGFRDISRLASGDVRMHRDICLSNQEYLRPWLIETARTLEQIAAHLDDPDFL